MWVFPLGMQPHSSSRRSSSSSGEGTRPGSTGLTFIKNKLNSTLLPERRTVLGSIPASSNTVQSEGRQMKHCWVKCLFKKFPPNKLTWLKMTKDSRKFMPARSSCSVADPEILSLILIFFLHFGSRIQPQLNRGKNFRLTFFVALNYFISNRHRKNLSRVW